MRGEGGKAGRRESGAAIAWATLRRALSAVRRVAGMPDYLTHVEHLRRYHPERPVPTEREFFDEFTRLRYGDGPTRCC